MSIFLVAMTKRADDKLSCLSSALCSEVSLFLPLFRQEVFLSSPVLTGGFPIISCPGRKFSYHFLSRQRVFLSLPLSRQKVSVYVILKTGYRICPCGIKAVVICGLCSALIVVDRNIPSGTCSIVCILSRGGISKSA